MGCRRRTFLIAVLAGAVAVGAGAAAAPGLQIRLVLGPGQPVVGRAASIVVGATGTSPGARTKVSVWIAKGRVTRSFATRSQSGGRHEARVVFPTAGRWTFGARAGGARVQLGSVLVRQLVPLTFIWPTSVDVESSRTLLLVENGDGRVTRVDPSTGKTSLVTSIDRPYALAHGPSGAEFLSAGKSLYRLDAAGHTTRVADADSDIGPVAVAANGDVYYTTATAAFRLAGGSGTPEQVAAGLSGPHGLAVTSDGGLLVSDTGNGQVKRVDLKTGNIEKWGDISAPRAIDIAPDGSVYIVDKSTNRVVHLIVDGRRIGSVKHVFFDPYAVKAAPDGSLYVVDTSATGRLYRVAPNGTTTVLSR